MCIRDSNQRKDYLLQKRKIMIEWLSELPETVTAIDLGANEGTFSFLLSARNMATIATDSDHSSINKLYRKIKQEKEKNILPLLMDLANPTPAIGCLLYTSDAADERSSVDLGG